MAYVAPTIRSVGDAVTAADYNIMANDVIAHQASIIRLGFQTRGTLATSDHYTINQNSLASAADIFSADISWTADGTSSYVVEAYCPSAVMPASNEGIFMKVVTGTGTNIGQCELYGSAGGQVVAPMFIKIFYTPAAGTATVNVRATKSTTNGELRFGGGYAPGYVAVYGPPTT